MHQKINDARSVYIAEMVIVMEFGTICADPDDNNSKRKRNGMSVAENACHGKGGMIAM